MAKNTKQEVRVAPAPGKPTASRRAIPAKPVAKEKRVTPVVAEPAPAATSKPKATKVEPAEKRVVAVKPTAAKPAKAPKPVGKSKSVLARYHESLLTLDEFGAEVTELIASVVRPCFGSLADDPTIPVSLAIAERAISRTITGTGVPELDKERFAVKEGDLILITEHKTGGVTIYNTDTAEPVAMVMDARARKSVQYAVVPTDPAEFDAFFKQYCKKAEAIGVPLSYATV